jgi:hypothetical protein
MIHFATANSVLPLASYGLSRGYSVFCKKCFQPFVPRPEFSGFDYFRAEKET